MPRITLIGTNFFLATDLKETKTDRHGPEEEFMTIELIEFEKCMAMIKSGEIVDGKTVIGLLQVALLADTYI